MSGVAMAQVEREAVAPENIWRSPLVPVALALTAGVLMDRAQPMPLPIYLGSMLGALAAWRWRRGPSYRRLPLMYLALAAVAFGASYHHYRRFTWPADDIGNLAPAEPRPVQVRGMLESEPLLRPAIAHSPLRSFDQVSGSSATLRLTTIDQGGSWQPVSGRARLHVPGVLFGLHAGDEVEVVGRLQLPRGPSNPGEFDYASTLLDDGIRAVLDVRAMPDGVTRLRRGWPASFTGWLAVIRGWGQQQLANHLPESTSGLAIALLLGEGAPLTTEDWDQYLRTGIIHVLAISGQHLVVLAAAIWIVLRLIGVRQRSGAIGVALFLLAYALVTGGRPPALRSAVAVCALAGAVVLRRRTPSANAFALAWIVVLLLNPSDIFGAGCLLSFLSVAVLRWGTGPILKRADDPLDLLVDQQRPFWLRVIRWIGREIALNYALTALIWLAVTPLAASRYHLVAPVGILLGPPLTWLTSLALIAGFLLLVCAAIAPPLAFLFAPLLHWPLAACTWLVALGDRLPAGHWTIANIPEWWTWIFTLGLLAFLTQPPLRLRYRWGLLAGAGWLCVGLIVGAVGLPSDELRCSFLAVGHGGCTVLETPEGRVLLYDAGALGGPEVTRRQIATFLWSRGISRIDEVFLSHADLDHFNGLPALLDRFSVGQVTWTATFADKRAAGVALVVRELSQRGVAVRTVKAGDLLSAGSVSCAVLHPPAEGVEGNENARSLVFQIRHAGHTILLTGDLEGAGLSRLLAQPSQPCDVMQAPHHGSRVSNIAALANWARPKVVVSCEGPPRGPVSVLDVYHSVGAHCLTTWEHGAVTIHSHPLGLSVETFRTDQRLTIRAGPRTSD